MKNCSYWYWQFSFLIIPFFVQCVVAKETLEILQVSQTGRTFTLNFGQFEGIAQGHEGRFYLRPNVQLNQPAIFIGHAVAIKVLPQYSVWHFKKLSTGISPQSARTVISGQKVVLFLTGNKAEALKKQEIRRRKVVLLAQEKEAMLREMADEERKEGPFHLTQRKDLYGTQMGEPLEFKLRAGKREDPPEIVDWIKWAVEAENEYNEGNEENEGKREQRTEETLNKTEIQNGKRILIGAKVKMGMGRAEWEKEQIEKDLDRKIDLYFLQEWNAGIGVLTFDEYPRQDEAIPYLREKSVTPTTYDMLMDKRQQRLKSYRESVSMMAKNGPDWSDDMTDEQIRNFLKDSGLKKELVRQQQALHYFSSHEAYLLYSLNLQDHQAPLSVSDPLVDERKYSLSVGFEFTGEKFKSSWSSYSLRGGIRKGQEIYGVDEINALSKELSFHVGMNYYPLSPPSRIFHPIFYGGAGFRWGQSEYYVQTPNHIINKNYRLFSLPSLWLGGKFRMGERIGFMGELSVEFLKFVSTDSNVLPGSPKSFSIQDKKLGFGMNFYF